VTGPGNRVGPDPSAVEPALPWPLLPARDGDAPFAATDRSRDDPTRSVEDPEPSADNGAAGRRRSAAQGRRGATLAQVNAVGPMLLLVLGALLGIATQMSTLAYMSLRVPALFAALFMVAQGLYELDRLHRDRSRAAERPVVVPGTEGLTPQSGRSYPAAPPSSGPTGQARMAIPVILMVLGGWLGLAVLRGSGGEDAVLNVLATTSAFVLFAIGWQVLLGSR
jgi:hypothetical protein